MNGKIPPSGTAGADDAAAHRRGPIPRRLAGVCFAAALAACAPVWAGGCGYSFEPLVRKEASGIHVPVFENRTLRREIEFGITEAVVRELRMAGWRISGSDSCDSVLLGRIVSVTESPLARDPSGMVTEDRLEVEVEFELLSRPEGSVIVSGKAAEAGEAVFASGETREKGLGRSFEELARTLARRLEPGLGHP